jgi:aminopeptidase N
LFDIAWDDRAIFRDGLIGAAQEALDRLPGASVYHIDLQIPDDFFFLQGREQVRYTNQEDEPLDEIYFRLFANTAGGASVVSELKVDGQDVEPVYEFADSALRVSLPAALQPGEQVVVQMNFELEVPREMGGNYGLFGYFDGILVLDEFYPVIPVYDDEGWNVEVPPPNADVPYFDASFYLVRVTAPDNLTVAASGSEVGHKQEADNQVLTFAAGPARGFYIAASENYAVINEKVGETTVNSYAFPELADGSELALQFAVDALESFNERFGIYPYTEFDVVSTPMQALGMEYPGIVAIAFNLYNLGEQIYGLPARAMLESATAHEVGHQWFYNVVGSDQVDEPWVDEAVVQYLTGLYFLDVYGENTAQGYRDSWYGRWERVETADIPIGRPARAYEGAEYGAIVYGRGPIFVMTLAEEMGQETFDEFLRDYYQSHEWEIGTSDSFRQLAEKHCQCDLTDLFEEWVYEK